MILENIPLFFGDFMPESDLPIALEENDLLRLFRWHRLDMPATAACDIVAIGSYTIRPTSAGFLTAALGSAVGVALFDRTAGVGGIASFLLAKPTSSHPTSQPEKYVESGLPLFIAELEAAGAAPDRIEAAVAGGSLQLQGKGCKELNQWSGLVVDFLLEQLRQRRIPLAAIEVGGVRPLSLLLDTKSWKASIELMEEHAPPSVSKVTAPTSGQIDHAIATTQPIPQIALNILALLEKGSSIGQLVDQIKQDQVIAAKILRFSNSPMYSTGREITSIDRAMVFLGDNNLAEIAIAAAVSASFGETGAGYGLMRGGLYKHALAVAHLAKALALETRLVDTGIAYTAGLLHDIGKIVLDRFVANALPFFYRNQAGDSKDYAEIERELFDTDHLEVGQSLAQKWHLSAPLTEVIRHHHWPEQAAPEHQRLTHLIYLADLLSSCYLPGVEMENINTEDLEERLKTLGLEPKKLVKIIEQVPWPSLMYF